MSGQMSGWRRLSRDPVRQHAAPRCASGERHLAEDLLDTAQVAHPGLGSTADPPADGLHRHAELPGGGLLGQALPAQRARHPRRERLGLRGLAALAVLIACEVLAVMDPAVLDPAVLVLAVLLLALRGRR